MNRCNRLSRCVLIFLLVVVCHPAAMAEKKHTGIVLADENGDIIFSRNPDTCFVPASTLKLLTGLAALKTLGVDYRFYTPVAFNNETCDLHIKGLGDPLFISEVIESFCRDIARGKEMREVRHILVDQSYFDPGIHIPGTGRSLNPYDATTGALCANFNTIHFKWDNTRRQFVSAEPQTPLLPVFLKDIEKTGLKKGRILLNPDQRAIYAGLLVKYFLQQRGIKVTGRVAQSHFPENSAAVSRVYSCFTLGQLVKKLLKYSNNFMANQLMLVLGVKTYGPPATLEKGVTALTRFAATRLALPDLKLAEGSGLSRKNKISPRQMLAVLQAFKPYHELLSVSGNQYFKTGTLSDVRSRAGYIKAGNGALYPFVIMVNKKNRGYRDILNTLKHQVMQHKKNR